MREIGYELKMVEEGKNDKEFEDILEIVEKKRDGYV
jgi:hypothetical protein